MSTQMQSISTRFSPDTIARLEEIAENQKRSRSDIIQEAVEGYLNSLAWFKAEIRKAEDDFDAGRFISHEDIKEKYRKSGVKC